MVRRESPSAAPVGSLRHCRAGAANARVPGGAPETPDLPPGVREHDGFLWRLALGVGYAGWVEEGWGYDYDERDSRWQHTGGGGLNMAFGGSWTDRYYLYLELNLNFPQLFGLGAGFGAYLGDNWFVDAAIGYHLSENGYLAATVGKEWWVGDQWLTGLSVRWMGGTGWGGRNDWTTAVTLNWSLTCN